jgi:hypothetical protein
MYIDHVLRPGDEQRPVVERLTRVEVEEVERELAAGGAALERFRHRDVVEGVPLAADQAGAQVELLPDAVGDDPVDRAPHGQQIAVDGAEHRHQRDIVRLDLELVQVRRIPVAGAQDVDLTVGGVVDHHDPVAEAGGMDIPLPPREHRLAVELLDLQVGRVGPGGQGLEPHEPAARVEDHRPVLSGAGVRRGEDVAGHEGE